MDDEFGHESTIEISHPDVDSALEMHLRSDDFCYKTREVDGSTTHLLKKMKKGEWTDHFTIEDKEVKGFDNEEMATFFILKVSRDRVNIRTTGVMLLVYFIVGVPVTMYISLALGITDPDSFASFLLSGTLMVPFICVCYIWSNSSEKSIDNRLYSTRRNFIDVLKKMRDLKEADYEKTALENRIQRLLDRFQTRHIG